MLSKKEIFVILRELGKANHISGINEIFVYVENELRKSMVEILTQSKEWGAAETSFFCDFMEECKRITLDTRFEGFGKASISEINASFLNETIQSLLLEISNNNLISYFRQNPDHAYYVLMNIEYFPFEDFIEVFKDVILSCPNDSLPISYYQSSPLFLSAFRSGFGFEAVKKIKQSDLLNIILFISETSSTKSFELIMANNWISSILMPQPVGYNENFKMDETIQLLVINKDENGQLILKDNSKSECGRVYSFIIEKELSSFKVNDLDQLYRVKHLINVLSLNTNISNYFSIIDSKKEDLTHLLAAKDEANAEINKKKIYGKIRELEKEQNNILNKIKKIGKEKNVQYKNWFYPTHKGVTEKIEIALSNEKVIKHKFNYIAFILHNKCGIEVLNQMNNFIENNPIYYDKDKKALNEEGTELYLLENLF